ncbi:hypothetical protein AGABI2DRAFT_78419 [Agaricus bisporus var. bisporus H97]|uniref:hypothetical protein n=1 Tax=Agaricus bisporus var. bisporus (strain H97 / ATCC MYA-4626 / FGSC 10389) TaxID=936046 RepID=UPI00029F79B6|nr:hypothetical protein AGABI2DRAFT_78419 [Agaricus bisporus var. bisporus H97]EKV42383.1 hypothetical protein AGABI2DRAFT_78419 [Agaricus bisporus var. bisporus H97]
MMNRDDNNCEPPDPANTVTDRLNTLLNSTGPGYTLQLCPGAQYLIQEPLFFSFPDQEISTFGYPTGDDRATLVVNGPVANGQGHTTAVDGTCANCSGVKLRHVQIDGTRRSAPPTQGGANIEMGGPNSGQLIEFVRSFDPRSWSCMHIAEGPLTCNNATIQNNDIGPCGSDAFQEWADGISLSCKNSVVRNNMVQGATDGGIVVFGAPGSRITNNTIWIVNQTLLGGINMVDYDPFQGDYTDTVVQNNVIFGGFANESPEPGEKLGVNTNDAIIKIGIAIGPRSWFGERYGANVSHSGTVIGNSLTGAFSYAMALTSAQNFTVQGNILFGNTSFIGARGPNCSETDTVPTPAAFILDTNTTGSLSVQTGFEAIRDGDSLTCVLPPNGGDFWPFGSDPSFPPSAPTPKNPPRHKAVSSGGIAGIVVGCVLGLIAAAVMAWLIRRWMLKRRRAGKTWNISKPLPSKF